MARYAFVKQMPAYAVLLGEPPKTPVMHRTVPAFHSLRFLINARVVIAFSMENDYNRDTGGDMLLNNTIFDDVFRTLCEKNPKLLVPLINEIFHTDYSMNEEITLLSGEHHSLDDLKEVITDSAIKIRDHIYHIECQSNPDGSILIRMIEYDFHIALEHAVKKDDTYEIDFPDSAVLYLRHTKNTPDRLFMKINFPNGEHVKYELPIIFLYL